jgi:hypothetical protein
MSICTGDPASSLSANRDLSGRTGQGRILEAETVIQAAKNVRPKSDETNERRWVKRRTLWMDILNLERVRYGASNKKQYTHLTSTHIYHSPRSFLEFCTSHSVCWWRLGSGFNLNFALSELHRI